MVMIFAIFLYRLKASDSDPKLIQKHSEQLEVEKKAFEDLEFQLMEEEAHKEAETDEVSSEIRYLENEIQTHEDKLNEIDVIQSQLLSEEFKSNQEYDLLKRSLHRSIQEVRKSVGFQCFIFRLFLKFHELLHAFQNSS